MALLKKLLLLGGAVAGLATISPINIPGVPDAVSATLAVGGVAGWAALECITKS